MTNDSFVFISDAFVATFVIFSGVSVVTVQPTQVFVDVTATNVVDNVVIVDKVEAFNVVVTATVVIAVID